MLRSYFSKTFFSGAKLVLSHMWQSRPNFCFEQTHLKLWGPMRHLDTRGQVKVKVKLTWSKALQWTYKFICQLSRWLHVKHMVKFKSLERQAADSFPCPPNALKTHFSAVWYKKRVSNADHHKSRWKCCLPNSLQIQHLPIRLPDETVCQFELNSAVEIMA